MSILREMNGSSYAAFTLFCVTAFSCLAVSPTKAANTSNSENPSLEQQMPVRGVVRSAKQSSISSELTAVVHTIGFKEGERFFKDDLLVRLDCGKQIAEWDAAKALKREMDLSLKSAIYLRSENLGNQFKTDTARARVDRAAADLKAAAKRVDQCEIRAPYNGIVTKVAIQEYEISRIGKPLVSIVSYNAPRLELIVPSNWLTWLGKGRKFDFNIDETQSTHTCKITRLGAIVDPVSQTAKIYAEFLTSPMNILPGMSGTAKFQ